MATRHVNMEICKALLERGFTEFTATVDYQTVIDWLEDLGFIVTVHYDWEFFVGYVFYTDMDNNAAVCTTERYNNRYSALDAAIERALALI